MTTNDKVKSNESQDTTYKSMKSKIILQVYKQCKSYTWCAQKESVYIRGVPFSGVVNKRDIVVGTYRITDVVSSLSCLKITTVSIKTVKKKMRRETCRERNGRAPTKNIENEEIQMTKR